MGYKPSYPIIRAIYRVYNSIYNWKGPTLNICQLPNFLVCWVARTGYLRHHLPWHHPWWLDWRASRIFFVCGSLGEGVYGYPFLGKKGSSWRDLSYIWTWWWNDYIKTVNPLLLRHAFVDCFDLNFGHCFLRSSPSQKTVNFHPFIFLN